MKRLGGVGGERGWERGRYYSQSSMCCQIIKYLLFKQAVCGYVGARERERERESMGESAVKREYKQLNELPAFFFFN